MTNSGSGSAMVDPAIFGHLQTKIDEDTQVREEIKNIVQALERKERVTMSILSKAHSTPQAELKTTLLDAQNAIEDQMVTISKLQHVASKHPYYKYNSMWTREMQNVSQAVILWVWLGGDARCEVGTLLTMEDLGATLQVPVNLKEIDAFHLTIEEYLHALVSLIEELVRLAVNSVTLGDYQRPLQISRFVKDLHAGFQILNLKNDSLRRRSDSIKYNLKKVEDVVYDLSLRNLVHREPGPA